jgi:hypothetical protein
LTAPAPFVFVVGCGRSGTTLFRAMLDSHPLMAVPPESYFVAEMAGSRGRYDGGGRFDLDRFRADLRGNSWFGKWGIDDDRLRAALDPAPADLAEALRRVFRSYADAFGKSRYADKTPSYVRHIGLLSETFPEARFLHVVRDGRDVALSFLRMPFGPNSLEEGALFWRSRTLTGRQVGAALGRDRYREIRYEDLVQHPEDQLREVVDFAGLPYDPAMLRFNEHADRLIATGVPGAHERLASPPTPSTRTWRDKLSQQQVRRFELLAGDALACFGYELSTGPATRFARARAVAAAQARTYGSLARKRLKPGTSTS